MASGPEQVRAGNISLSGRRASISQRGVLRRLPYPIVTCERADHIPRTGDFTDTLSRLSVYKSTGNVETVPRLFHLYLPGRPGIGMLLLRNSVAAILLTEVNAQYPVLLPWWIALALLLLAVSLCLGFLTFFVSLFCGVFEVAALFLWNDHPPASILYASFALSLALVGPGAYSIDAKLFSRRVTVFPNTERPGDTSVRSGL